MKMPNIKVQFQKLIGSDSASTKIGNAVRSFGDKARDARQWTQAVEYYSAFLEQNPEEFEIWVQLGNCLKEAGRHEKSLEAYETAIAKNDTNADAYLQKGHILKILGRFSDAYEAYAKSFLHNPHGNPAYGEMMALNLPAREISELGNGDIIQPADGVIFLDVTDLIEYLRVNISLSGIQRVVANLILHSLEGPIPARFGCIRAVLPDYNGSQVFSVDVRLLDGLLGIVVAGKHSRHIIDRALEAVLNSKKLIRVKKSDTLLIAGAFWIYQRYDLLNKLRHEGVRISVFIHDLIQITNPEFVEPAATIVFRRSIVDVLCVSSYIVTNSDFVANDVKRYLDQRLNFKIPVAPVKLATELGIGQVDMAAVFPEYIDLVKEEYALCVGTIEIRKNHLYLIKIWERLIDQFGDQTPNLVLVGKWGWEIEDLRNYLHGSDYLGGRLYIYNGIPDGDLTFLYKNCLFTIYPSFAEGWGLPVGESLGYGKPCIASKTTAIPEVGGDFCKYIDPYDVEDGYQVVSSILEDRRGLNKWTSEIQKNFRPRTWKTFALDLFEVVDAYAKDKSLEFPGNNCILETSEIASFGNDSLAQLDLHGEKLISARMSRMSGWHGLESWGCWAARRRATLRFTTRIPQGVEVTLFFYLRTPDGDEVADCTLRVGDNPTSIFDIGPVPRWCTATGFVGPNGIVEIAIISGKGFLHHHGRELYVGILSIAVVPTNDFAARLRVVDKIVPGGLPRQMINVAHENF